MTAGQTITAMTWKTVVRPMRTTFATSLGSKTCATSVIVCVRCSDGSVGLGEVPTSFVLPHETVAAIGDILAKVKGSLLGKSPEDYTRLTNGLRKQYPVFHMTISGLEVALYRAHLVSQGQSECDHRGVVETDITIPFMPRPGIIDPWIKKAIRNKFHTYKVKVSGDIKKDIQFCKHIHGMLTQAGRPFVIRLDGNQGFTAKSAMELLEQLDKIAVGTELFEQPLKRDDYKGLKALTKQSPVPIIADETVFCADDCKRVIDGSLAHGVNIKIAKSGISESVKILKLARLARLKLMIGCMTETMTGLSAGIYLAANTGVFDYIDLDSVHFLYHRRHCGNITIDNCRYHIHKTS